MTAPVSPWLKFRILLSFFFLLLLFTTILARFFQLQILEAEVLKDIAKKQHKKTIALAPKRGAVYDNNMKVMAVSIDTLSLYAHPKMIKDMKSASYRLSKALKIREKEIVKKLSLNRPFVWIKRKLSDSEINKIKGLNIKGIGFLRESKRVYTEPFLAPHVIGFAGMDSQGLEGIELYYDSYLRGHVGYRTGYKDALGREILLDGLYMKDTSRGLDLVLTIDKNIQYIAEKALKEAVKTYRPKGGVIILMDPYTGEILAMANEPSFNPNDISSASPDVWRNKAITDVFEPGSTFKIFLAAAALEEGKAKPDSLFYGEKGLYKVSNRIIHDHKRFGWLSLKDVIKFSSNIGAVKIVQRLDSDIYYRYIKDFGFGMKTGIDLPGEASGIVKTRKDWSKVTMATMSFGQGISVTGIQLITALSAIANGGYLLRPHVVKRIVSRGGKVIKVIRPQIKRRILSEETCKRLTAILEEVTETDGTGARASLEGYSVAGKTGTAQKVNLREGGYYKDKYISSFIGFVPAEDPMLAILVVIDEPHGAFYGGEVAAPIFREIAEKVLPYIGITPKKNDGDDLEIVKNKSLKSKRIVRRDVSQLFMRNEKKIIMPQFQGKSLREVLREGWGLSLNVRVVGSGRAISQAPEPKTPLEPGDTVYVYFEDMIAKTSN